VKDSLQAATIPQSRERIAKTHGTHLLGVPRKGADIGTDAARHPIHIPQKPNHLVFVGALLAYGEDDVIIPEPHASQSLVDSPDISQKDPMGIGS
jgi:hypothetical protein